MHCTIEDGPSYTCVRVAGRLNMVGAPALRETVGGIVAGGATRVVLDLGGSEFMDSSGLGALIGCLKLARQAGGDLRVANLQPQLRMVLELTSMDRVLTPYGTVEEAFPGA